MKLSASLLTVFATTALAQRGGVIEANKPVEPKVDYRAPDVNHDCWNECGGKGGSCKGRCGGENAVGYCCTSRESSPHNADCPKGAIAFLATLENTSKLLPQGKATCVQVCTDGPCPQAEKTEAGAGGAGAGGAGAGDTVEYCWTQKYYTYINGFAKNDKGVLQNDVYDGEDKAKAACIALGDGCTGITYDEVTFQATVRGGTESEDSGDGEISLWKIDCKELKNLQPDYEAKEEICYTEGFDKFIPEFAKDDKGQEITKVFKSGGARKECDALGDKCTGFTNGKDFTSTIRRGTTMESGNDGKRSYMKTTCYPFHPCYTKNGGCQQKCTKNGSEAVCNCEKGFTLQDDKKSCKEIFVHPCDVDNGGCAQFCTKKEKEAVCSCRTGQELQADKKSCAAAAVNGNWGKWSEYTSCAGGLKTRTRKCDDPAPKNGGAACEIKDKPPALMQTESASCDVPVNGNWGSWGEYSTCKDGKQLRTRACNNPVPQFGGNSCPGTPIEQKVCKVVHPCDYPDNGGCAQICTKKEKEAVCSCKTGQELQADKKSCAAAIVNGNWGSWGVYSTCKDGKQLRTRQCNNPAPQFGGKSCPGTPIEQRVCRGEPAEFFNAPQALGFARAKAFCKSKNMIIPKPSNAAENKKFADYGQTWIDVIVTAILDGDRQYGNWERRLRGYLNKDGLWSVASSSEERPFFCVKQTQSATCKSQFTAEMLQNENWTFANRGSNSFSTLGENDLDSLDFGTRFRANCGWGRSQAFICVRDRSGAQYLAKCKNKSCGSFVRRRVSLQNIC